MTKTFDDRLLAVVLEEARNPTLPSFDDEPASTPAPLEGSPRRRRVVTGVGIAAALAVLAGGGAVLFASDDAAPVRVAAQPTTTAAPSIRYLTFGDPIGTVYRVGQVEHPRPGVVFRSDATPGWRLSLDRGMSSSFFDRMTVVDTVGGRELRSLTLSESGGKPFGVYFWKEADGTVWGLSAYNASEGDVVDAAGEAARRSIVDAFLSDLSYADGAFASGDDWEQYRPIDEASAQWTLTDDRRSLSSIDASRVGGLDAVEGERTSVRGHDAVFNGRDLYWQESAGEILRLSVHRADPRYDDGAPSTTLAEILGFAEALVSSDDAAFRALPLLRGAKDERLVILPPPGADTAEYAVDYSSADGSGSMSGPVGVEGSSIEIPAGVTTVWIYAAGGDEETTFSADPLAVTHPACARRVDVPAPGEATVTVTLDRTCTR